MVAVRRRSMYESFLPSLVAPTFLGMVLSKDEIWRQRRALTLVRNRFVLSATPCRLLTFLDAKKPFLGKWRCHPNHHLRKERFLLYNQYTMDQFTRRPNLCKCLSRRRSRLLPSQDADQSLSSTLTHNEFTLLVRSPMPSACARMSCSYGLPGDSVQISAPSIAFVPSV
ncbi:hypothetical protein PAEVO_55840 [Paenibacillus sp. GM2FR]|nr:hypothetical protein PAEVO_55840 [Paenibacillus sp. GM2FR]